MKRTFSWTSTNGTWVCPANVTRIRIYGWGSGGAGGSSGTTMGGGGGGGGAYSEVILQTVVPGRTYQIQVGVRYDTEFYYGASMYCKAVKGDNGTAGGDPDEPGSGGAGGDSSNCIGDYGYKFSGDYGNDGPTLSAQGGAAAHGGGGGGTSSHHPGYPPGGGGSGGPKSSAGGAGASGALYIDVYYDNEILQTVVPT